MLTLVPASISGAIAYQEYPFHFQVISPVVTSELVSGFGGKVSFAIVLNKKRV
jgi:hypothetical protein